MRTSVRTLLVFWLSFLGLGVMPPTSDAVEAGAVDDAVDVVEVVRQIGGWGTTPPACEPSYGTGDITELNATIEILDGEGWLASVRNDPLSSGQLLMCITRNEVGRPVLRIKNNRFVTIGMTVTGAADIYRSGWDTLTARMLSNAFEAAVSGNYSAVVEGGGQVDIVLADYGITRISTVADVEGTKFRLALDYTLGAVADSSIALIDLTKGGWDCLWDIVSNGGSVPSATRACGELSVDSLDALKIVGKNAAELLSKALIVLDGATAVLELVEAAVNLNNVGVSYGPRLRGSSLAVSTTEAAYWIDPSGRAHPVTTSDVFNCLAEGGSPIIRGFDAAYLRGLAVGEYVMDRCRDLAWRFAVVIDPTDGSEWFINGSWERRRLVDEPSARCKRRAFPSIALTHEQIVNLPRAADEPAVPCVEPGGVASALVTASDGEGSWVIDATGWAHPVAGSETFWCYAAQLPVLENRFTTAEAASLGIRQPAATPCLDTTRVTGSVIQAGANAWLVDEQAVRHVLPTGGDFLCAVARDIPVVTVTADEAATLALGDPQSLWCFSRDNAVDTILVDTDNVSWQVVKYGGLVTKLRIESGATFHCLEQSGLQVHRGITAAEISLIVPTGIAEACVDPAVVGGGVLVSDPETGEGFVLAAGEGHGVLHRVRSAETWACLSRTHIIAATDYTHKELSLMPLGTAMPNCLAWQDYVGWVLANEDGEQVFLTTAGQRGVRDGRTSRCLTEWKGYPVVEMDEGYLDSIPVDSAGWATCDTGVVDGTIVRNSATGWSGRKYTSADGVAFLAPIVTAETFRCLEARGAPRINVTGAKIEAFLIGSSSEAECVDVNAYKGKLLVSTDGVTTFWVDPVTAILRPVSLGGVYLCLTLWQAAPVHGELFNSAQFARFTAGPAATCTAHLDRARERIVTAGENSIFVDSSGTAHNIRTSNAYACLREQGVAVITVPSHAWQQAFSFGNDQPGCNKLLVTETGATYRELADGRVLWVQDTQSYYCYADVLPSYRVVRVTQNLVDQLGVDGWAARCLSPMRYVNSIIKRADGVSWIVDSSGRRRHVPDGYSMNCYLEKGYRVAEATLSAEQAASIPEIGRMPFCLAKWQANGTIIRECSGTAYYVENSARRWIPSGWTYEAIQEWGRPVLNTCLNWEHINSLPEVGRMPYLLPRWRFRNTLVHHASGAVFKTDGNACRYHVRDWLTVERLQELGHGFTGWNVNDEEINSLPYCGTHRYMLAKWRVENRVVRGPDGTSWFVRGGEWYWISTGALWNHLVSRYGLASGTYGYTWEHINSIKWDRGRWAWWWM